MINLRAKISRLNLSVLEEGVMYFFIYGLVGWLIDTVFESMVFGQFLPGGMFRSFLLPVPFAPIYGFGALAIIYLTKHLWGRHIILSIPLVGVIATAVEYCGGVMTIALFGHRAWDYSGSFLNLQGHTDLFHAIAWTLLGWSFIKFIHPAVEKFVKNFLAKMNFGGYTRGVDK
ncbi:MAG: putative ABC transporter permease [Patescibacteria group bacterium]|nr:putative ABC transporter permease [Patescibacteria group bacterium]